MNICSVKPIFFKELQSRVNKRERSNETTSIDFVSDPVSPHYHLLPRPKAQFAARKRVPRAVALRLVP